MSPDTDITYAPEPSLRVPARAQRRSQAERRATTRAALLDAAIECLVKDGYTNTTRRAVAERAGVTAGALQHHFRSKGELLGETVAHVQAKWASEMLSSEIPKTGSIRRRHELLLDRMWSIYRGPLFRALLELGVGARTDPEVGDRLAGARDEAARWNAIAAPLLYPEHANRSELIELVETGQATMSGLALDGFGGRRDPDEAWPTVRRHLMAMSAQILADPDLAP